MCRIKITPQKLAQVEAAEDILWDLGFRQFRVRHHGDVARIEVDKPDRIKLLDHAEEITEQFKLKAGFTYVSMDLVGYRRGSMNEVSAPGNIPVLNLIPLSNL